MNKRSENRVILEGDITDVEFNGMNTRINIACCDCDSLDNKTHDACTYIEGRDESGKYQIGEHVVVHGYVRCQSEDVLVWIIVDNVYRRSETAPDALYSV